MKTRYSPILLSGELFNVAGEARGAPDVDADLALLEARDSIQKYQVMNSKSLHPADGR